MLEKNFQSCLTHSFKEAGGFLYKIPDCGFDKKPFDACGVLTGRPVAMELKWLTSPKAFPLSRFEDHQIQGLLNWWSAGGDSYFIIGVDYGRADKRIFVWKNDEILGLKERKADKRNILKKEFDKLPYFSMKGKDVPIILIM